MKTPIVGTRQRQDLAGGQADAGRSKVGGIRQLASAAIDQHGQAHAARAAIVVQLVDDCAHQYVTFATATPLQGAVAAALDLDDSYYQALAADYEGKRDFLAGVLTGVGLRISVPHGTYFIMADFSPLNFDGDDVDFCRWLTTEIGVAAIPASAMYAAAAKPLARAWARFAFCKRAETLERAAERLRRLRAG